MKNIDRILKENLQRKYQMNESFEKISLMEDENERFGSTIDYFGKLIDEGYDNDSLETVVNEQFGWLQKLFGGNTANPADVSTQSNIISKAGSGGWSQFKEFLVKKLLGYIGFEGPLASAFATAFTEMSVMDLIATFRSREGCLAHGPDVADAVSEALVTYMIQSNTKQDSIAYNFLRNTIWEYIHASQFGEQLSKMICNSAYNMKGKITQKMGNKKTPVAPQKITQNIPSQEEPLPS